MGLSEQQVKAMRQVAGRSALYLDEDLSQWDPDRLLSSSWESLRFFFGHSFYQGRNDKLSTRFEAAAEAATGGWLGSDPSAAMAGLADAELSEGGELDRRLRASGVPKRMDRLMVLSALAFVQLLPQANIVAWTVREVEAAGLRQVFRKLKGIASVGDKIASFYLRDIDFLFHVPKQPRPTELVFTQPYDTWVQQVSGRLGLVAAGDSANFAKRKIVEACIAAGVNPNEYNVGAWWVGAREGLDSVSWPIG